MLKQACESSVREEEGERQPAGGGKTKGKVKGAQERERGSGRGHGRVNRGRMGTEERTRGG